MIPSKGRIVEYTLTRLDAEYINRRRNDASTNDNVGNSGFVLHVGNPVYKGDTFPMMIVKVNGEGEYTTVNGQVHLDGNDIMWATSRKQGPSEGMYREFARV